MTVTVLYTDSDKVRAAAGIDDADISDGDLTASSVAEELTVDLNQWCPTHAAIKAAGIIETPAPSAEEANRWLLLQLYCQFMGAAIVAGQAYRILQKITDGKNQQARYNSLHWDEVQRSLYEKAAKYRRLLEEAMGTAGVAVNYPVMSASTPTFDPITG